MSNLVFKKAEKTSAKLRIGITGPSGSGKTFSALRLASGMGGKVAVIDTERGSASLYSDKFNFDVLEITPPYTTEKYIEAISAAEKAGYEILVIDSITHAWAGEGGLLNQKEQMDARGGNSFANWAKMTPKQDKFVAAILHSSVHIITTMRSKQEYILSENSNGKQAPKKVGLAPIQRDGFEYELTTVFDVAINHEAETSKDRTGIFADKIFKITEETGKTLKDWIISGKAAVKAEPVKEPVKIALAPEPSPEPTQEVDPEDLGSFVVTFGTKYKDRKLKEIDNAEIVSFMTWMENDAKKKNKPLAGNFLDFTKAATAYLQSQDSIPF